MADWKRIGLGVATGGASEGVRVGAKTEIAQKVGKAVGLIDPDEIDQSPLDGVTDEVKADKIRQLEREGRIDAVTAEAYRRALGLPPSHVTEPVLGRPDLQDDTEPGAVNAAHTAAPGSTLVDKASDGDLAAPSKVTYDDSYDPIKARDPGNASMEDETTIGKSQVDDAALALRGQQLAAAESAVHAPSSAAAQFRAALIASQEAQLGAAAQARGADRAGARREAVIAIGRDSIQGAEKSAELAAREQQAKNDSYASTLAGVSGQDLGFGTTNANLDSSRALQQGLISSARSRSNVQEANRRALDKAKFEEAADALNSKNQFELKKGNLDASTTNAANDLDASKTKYLGATDVSKYNAGQANVTRTTDADRDVTVGLSNTKADNDVAATERLRRERLAADNAKALREFALEQARFKLEAAKSQDAHDVARQSAIQSGANGVSAAPDLAAGSTNNLLRIAEGRVGVNKTDAENKQAGYTRLTKMFSDGAAAAATKSDERVKRGVSRASKSDLNALTDAFQAATFRYKGKHDDGELHAGTASAQAIEKTKLGKGLVSKDKDGVRVVDRAGLAMLLAAAAAKSTRRSA